ncbi:hypothetical protein PPACK8108_LOCUS8441 [Phakopsora pachyrhizi]|uniref:Uncharacterized protein n=1 Tax=Phakopsora pachyrhizi TaxID=170000 RepID=A0AAV0AX96_PHAPC|nr:hypothetical protein PPACK8108_LOCUS8441 [Phakopsora pachyrhizi]
MKSAGQDWNVKIWTQDGTRGTWKQHMLDQTGCGSKSFSGPVWSLSGRVGGNILAVTGDDIKVIL